MARGRGIPERKVIGGHVLRVALPGVATQAAMVLVDSLRGGHPAHPHPALHRGRRPSRHHLPASGSVHQGAGSGGLKGCVSNGQGHAMCLDYPVSLIIIVP
jgi:hypothetical protein